MWKRNKVKWVHDPQGGLVLPDEAGLERLRLSTAAVKRVCEREWEDRREPDGSWTRFVEVDAIQQALTQDGAQ